MEKGLHVELHEGEKENNQRRKMSDELKAWHYKDLEQLYKDECAIVDRCWKALGITTYKEANGKSIYELIEENRSRLKIAVETLEHIRDYAGGETSRAMAALAKIRSI